MSTPVRVRRLTDAEGRQLQRIVRRGSGKSDNSVVKWRRALVVLASAGGNEVAVIATLVQTSPDRVREMIHRFNEKGMAALDPAWAGGRPRRITTTERELIVTSATARPGSLGMPFTRWSLRKLAHYLATKPGPRVAVSIERLRQILAEEQITFQATKTWKESPDPCASTSSRSSRTSWSTAGIGPLPSTSSAPSPSSPRPGTPGHRDPGRSGCGPTTPSRMGPGSCSAGTRSETTASSGGSSEGRGRRRRCGPSRRSGGSAPTTSRST